MLQQNLVQKQETKILPQQIQLLNLFHLNTIELEHRIEQELEDNPFLDKKRMRKMQMLTNSPKNRYRNSRTGMSTVMTIFLITRWNTAIIYRMMKKHSAQ